MTNIGLNCVTHMGLNYTGLNSADHCGYTTTDQLWLFTATGSDPAVITDGFQGYHL